MSIGCFSASPTSLRGHPTFTPYHCFAAPQKGLRFAASALSLQIMGGKVRRNVRNKSERRDIVSPPRFAASFFAHFISSFVARGINEHHGDAVVIRVGLELCRTLQPLIPLRLVAKREKDLGLAKGGTSKTYVVRTH